MNVDEAIELTKLAETARKLAAAKVKEDETRKEAYAREHLATTVLEERLNIDEAIRHAARAGQSYVTLRTHYYYPFVTDALIESLRADGFEVDEDGRFAGLGHSSVAIQW